MAAPVCVDVDATLIKRRSARAMARVLWPFLADPWERRLLIDWLRGVWRSAPVR